MAKAPLIEETPKKIIKNNVGTNKSKDVLNMSPYFKEIKSHNKTLGKSKSNKEINVKIG